MIPPVVRWSDPDPVAAADAVVNSWVGLAGPRLAGEVAVGAVCDRCARRTLVTVGLAVGIGPVRLARDLLLPYQRALAEIAERRADDLSSER